LTKIKNASTSRQHDGDCYTLRKYAVTIDGQVGNAGDPGLDLFNEQQATNNNKQNSMFTLTALNCVWWTLIFVAMLVVITKRRILWAIYLGCYRNVNFISIN
jgi:hypothetical protein